MWGCGPRNPGSAVNSATSWLPGLRSPHTLKTILAPGRGKPFPSPAGRTPPSDIEHRPPPLHTPEATPHWPPYTASLGTVPCPDHPEGTNRTPADPSRHCARFVNNHPGHAQLMVFPRCLLSLAAAAGSAGRVRVMSWVVHSMTSRRVGWTAFRCLPTWKAQISPRHCCWWRGWPASESSAAALAALFCRGPRGYSSVFRRGPAASPPDRQQGREVRLIS